MRDAEHAGTKTNECVIYEKTLRLRDNFFLLQCQGFENRFAAAVAAADQMATAAAAAAAAAAAVSVCLLFFYPQSLKWRSSLSLFHSFSQCMTPRT